MNITTLPGHELVSRITALRMSASDDYETSKRLAQPFLDELNSRTQKVAAKFGKRPKKITFLGFPTIRR